MKSEICDSTSSSVKVSISAIALDTKSKDRRIIKREIESILNCKGPRPGRSSKRVKCEVTNRKFLNRKNRKTRKISSRKARSTIFN